LHFRKNSSGKPYELAQFFTNALWADKIKHKRALGTSPYYLVYGKEAILPPNVLLASLHIFEASRGQPSTALQK
jgi:hypothetical protein